MLCSPDIDGSFHKSHSLIHDKTALWHNQLTKVPVPNIIIFRLRFQQLYELFEIPVCKTYALFLFVTSLFHWRHFPRADSIVVTCGSISFLYKTEQYSTVWMSITFSLSNGLLMNEHFWIESISWLLWIVLLSLRCYCNSPDLCLEMRLPDHVAILYLFYSSNRHTVFHSNCHLRFLHRMGDFQHFTFSLAHFQFFSFFWRVVHLIRMRWYFHK